MTDKKKTKPSPSKEDLSVRDLLKNITKRKVGYGAAAAILVTFLAYLGSQIFAGILIGSWANIAGKDSAEVLGDIGASTYLQFSFLLIVGIVTLYVIWAFLKSRGNSLADIGLARKPNIKDIFPAIKTFVVYFLLMIVVSIIVKSLTQIDTEQEQILGFEDSSSNTLKLVLVFFSLVIIPPIVEEIMVRGFLYTGLKKTYKFATAAVVTSLIFGIAHLQLGSGEPPLWIAAIDTFVLSMFLIRLREKTGSLWSGMLVHFIKNGLAFLFIFILNISSF